MNALTRRRQRLGSLTRMRARGGLGKLDNLTTGEQLELMKNLVVQYDIAAQEFSKSAEGLANLNKDREDAWIIVKQLIKGSGHAPAASPEAYDQSDHMRAFATGLDELYGRVSANREHARQALKDGAPAVDQARAWIRENIRTTLPDEGIGAFGITAFILLVGATVLGATTLVYWSRLAKERQISDLLATAESMAISRDTKGIKKLRGDLKKFYPDVIAEEVIKSIAEGDPKLIRALKKNAKKAGIRLPIEIGLGTVALVLGVMYLLLGRD